MCIRDRIDHLPAATPEVSATQANLDLTLVVTNPTAINDLKNTLSDLAIYPNPMTKSAELSFNSETSCLLYTSRCV